MCLFTARHQNAAVVILQQVLITPSVDRHMMAYLLNFNRLGVARKRQLRVANAPTFGAAFTNGATIGRKPRLDLTLS